MEKKCVYCKNAVSDERAMDVCDHCGRKVWGDKMFKAILNNTNTEKAKGNMELGRVSESNDSGSIQEMHRMINDSRRAFEL